MVISIELVGIECGLLFRVSQKRVSTKWRIIRATHELARTRFVGKAKPFFCFEIDKNLSSFTNKTY